MALGYSVLPESSSGYAQSGRWYVITSSDQNLRNLVSNPSIELGTSGYAAVSSTLLQKSSYSSPVKAARGGFCLQVNPNGGSSGQGVYYSSIDTSAAPGNFSVDFDFVGKPGGLYKAYLASNTGTVIGGTYTFTSSGSWQRIHFQVSDSTGASTRRLYILTNYNAVLSPGELVWMHYFYIDGVSVCSGTGPYTYFDGDSLGFQATRLHYWEGSVHASTSIARAYNRRTGKLTSFEDLGISVISLAGLGFNPVQIDATQSNSGTLQLQKSFPLPKSLEMACSLTGASRKELARLRTALYSAFSPDRAIPSQPLRLLYRDFDLATGQESSGIFLDVLYAGGLEGVFDNDFQERFILKFTFLSTNSIYSEFDSPDAYVDTETEQALGNWTTIVAPHLMEYKEDGTWNLLGTGPDNTVYALLNLDGVLYVGGVFTACGGVANTAYIAKWTGTAWQEVGGGLNASVLTLCADSSGNVYAGGTFTNAGGVAAADYLAKWDGSSWSAVGGAVNGVVNSIVVDSTDNLYIGGSFSSVNGVSVNNAAKYSSVTATWSAMSAGGVLDDVVNIVVVGANDSIYVGGDFTNYAAKWTGSTWTFLTGLDGTVETGTALSNGNVLFGGTFTSASGISVGSLAIWNGYSWEAYGDGIGNSNYFTRPQQLIRVESNIAIGWFSVSTDEYQTFNSIQIPSPLVLTTESGSTAIGFPIILRGYPTALGYNPQTRSIFVGIYKTFATLLGYHIVGCYMEAENGGEVTSYPIITLIGDSIYAGSSDKVVYVYGIYNITTGKLLQFNRLKISADKITINLQPGIKSVSSKLRGILPNSTVPGTSLNSFDLVPGTNSLIVLFSYEYIRQHPDDLIAVFPVPPSAPILQNWFYINRGTAYASPEEALE